MRAIIVIPFLCLTTFYLHAQNEISVFGPENLCLGACAVWEVEDSISQNNVIYEWHFILNAGLGGFPGDTLFSTITERPLVDWCPITDGFFTIFVQIIDASGNEIYGIGQTTFLVEFFNIESFPDGVGSHTTNCTQDSFLINEAFPNNENCFEVCVGQTSTLNIDNLIILGANGTFFEIIPTENDWSVDGGTIIDYVYSSIEPRPDSLLVPTGVVVNWSDPGRRAISLSYFIDDICFNSTETMDFCFDVLAIPEADFTTQPPVNGNGILEVCEGQPIFFANTSETAETFIWDFGDGNGATVADPQHTYTQAGTYDVSLITSAACDCTDTTFLTVEVEGNDAPFIDCVATVCAGESVTYTANTNCSSYIWSISGNGTIVDGGGNADDFITVEWGDGPTGEITLATAGCPDLSTCTTAAFMRVPIVSNNTPIEGPTEVCRGSQTVYEVTPFTGTEYQWDVSSLGTIVAGQGTPKITVEWFDGPISPQMQSVSVDYNNCYLACGGSAQLDVFLRSEFYADGPIEVCANTQEDYTAFSTQTNLPIPADFTLVANDGSIAWTGGGNTVSIDFSVAAGMYKLQVVPQQPSDFCTPSYVQNIEVVAEPAPVMNVEGQTAVCPGIGYTYRVVDNAPGERYRWFITNGGTTTEREGSSIAVIWDANPPYQLEVMRVQPPLFCTSAAEVISINRFTGFSVQGDVQVCQDQIATYTSTATGDVSYEWSIQPSSAGTITDDPTAAQIDVLWHQGGAAQVILDICGQQESLAVTVNATPQPVVNHPAALCPNETFAVSTLLNYASYAWQDTVGNTISTDVTPMLGPGYYRLEVADAFGCTGTTTFSIIGFPESAINITTPDFNLFCNQAPSTRLYAANTEDGYTYQWYQDNTALPGETGTSYTATTFGAYYVAIIDENGCAFNSNTIAVAEDCGNGGGSGGAPTCPNSDHTFTISDNGACNERAYTAEAIGASATPFWNFDDPASGAANTATGANVTHRYSQPGFYRVFMGASYPDGMGSEALCVAIIPDTIYAVADFDYDGSCPGLPIQFYDISTFIADFTDIIAWNWNFGDPASGMNTSTDKDPMHTFSTGGIYQVTLTVTTSQGCTASIIKDVEIFPNPAVSFIEPPVTCAITALPFVADVAPTVAAVQWTFGEPGSGEADTSVLFNSFHQYDAPGTYTVNLEATSVYGCSNDFSETIEVTANTLSGEISPGGNQQLCEGDRLTLTAPGDPSDNWTWSTTENVQSINTTESGTYTVTLTDADGCTYTPAPSIVDIIPAPQSPIRAVNRDDNGQASSYTYDTLRVCHGQDVFLETVSQMGYTYLWSTGSINTSISFTEEEGKLLPEGINEITLDVVNTANGCASKAFFVVIVQPNPDQPILAGDSPTLCAGNSSTIQVTNPESGLTYSWSNGAAGTSINTTEAGNYTVIARNSLGCSTESESVEVLPGPDISFVPNGCHTRCAPDTICLPTIPGIVSYQWYQDGSPVAGPNGTMATLITTLSGSYTLEMTDANGCVQETEPLNLTMLPGFGSIRGLVFFDDNNNQTIDAGDSPAPNITLEADNGSGFNVDATTSESGDYAILDIPEDQYTVSIDTTMLPPGWKPLLASLDTTFMGCDQLVELYWLLIPDCTFDTTFTVEVCTGERYDFMGQTYPPGGPYTITNTPTNNCDSTWNFTVVESGNTINDLTVEVCEGSSYSYLGESYAIGTDTTFVLTSSIGCDSTVQLRVNLQPAAELTLLSEPSCPSAATGILDIQVLAGISPFSFTLNGGASQSMPQFTDLEVGTYTVVTTDANGCAYEETVEIESQEVLSVQLPTSVTIACDGPLLEVGPDVQSGDDGQLQYLWNDGLTSPVRTAETPGNYTLTVSNACESQTLALEMLRDVDEEASLVYVPNAFSPNGDKTNDIFQLYPSNIVDFMELDFHVYDRWGNQVFQTDEASTGWRGEKKGQRLGSGVYIWQFTATVDVCGEQQKLHQHGEVLLIR